MEAYSTQTKGQTQDCLVGILSIGMGKDNQLKQEQVKPGFGRNRERGTSKGKRSKYRIRCLLKDNHLKFAMDMQAQRTDWGDENEK